jgi:4-amino-4-deoxy-L-arabinose transferase-like glycosyltransferase
MPDSILHKYSWLFLALLFLLFSSPASLDYIFYFPDEKYYNDAVLQMMDKEDYFTPYQADGNERFLKPIVTYWTLIGSFKLFGVSKFSSRIFFWLTGAIIVIITFLMAKSLTKQSKTALPAAAIVAANPLVLMSAARSIPDILLTMFLTISAFGFLKIILDEKPKKIYLWMAFPGAAMAFETKGLPAAAYAGVSILYILYNPWRRKKIGALIDPLIIFVSAAVALSWFLIMYLEHGTGYLSSFFEDQTGRVSSRITLALKNMLLGILNLVAFTFPWILISASNPKKMRSYIQSAGADTKALFGFISLWVVMTILMSGAVFKFYDRYLLPVIPLAALFFASVITNSETKFQTSFLKFFIILNIIIFTINLLCSLFILTDIVLVMGTILTATILSGWYAGCFKKISTETSLALSIMLLYFNGMIMLYPFLMPNMGEQLVSGLEKAGISREDKVYVYGNIRTASNIRIQSNDRYNVISMDTVYVLPQEAGHFIVFSEKETDSLKLDNYEIITGSEEFSRIVPGKFPGALKDVIENIKSEGNTHFIGVPKK